MRRLAHYETDWFNSYMLLHIIFSVNRTPSWRDAHTMLLQKIHCVDVIELWDFFLNWPLKNTSWDFINLNKTNLLSILKGNSLEELIAVIFWGQNLAHSPFTRSSISVSRKCLLPKCEPASAASFLFQSACAQNGKPNIIYWPLQTVEFTLAAHFPLKCQRHQEESRRLFLNLAGGRFSASRTN